MKDRIELFYCYSAQDENLGHQLEKNLLSLKRQGNIGTWHDRKISPGTHWEKEIDTHLNTASIFLLLLSADFLNSEYCYGFEMKRAMERHNAGEALVIPILLRPTDWEGAPDRKSVV